MAFNIGIVGCGNVAFHLVKQLQNSCTPIRTVFHPDLEKAKAFREQFTELKIGNESNKSETTIFICAVSDSSMEAVLLEYSKISPCISTSGTFDISTIDSKFPLATIYPLQTFNKSSEIEFSKVPVFLECENNEFKQEISQIAANLSLNTQFLKAIDRQKMHVSAVISNNFSNHFFDLANQFCEENNLNFNDLIPLIQQSVSQLGSKNPRDLQTGPARRNDQETIEKHLHLLPNNLKLLYKQVSDSITKRFHSND